MSHPVGIDLTPKSAAHFTHPVPHRGALATSLTRGGMRWTQQLHQTNDASCVRRSRVVLTPRRWCQVLKKLTLLRDDGGKKARSPGRARSKPLKPLRREGRTASAEPVCSCAFLLSEFARETAGAARTRSSLRPLFCEGGTN